MKKLVKVAMAFMIVGMTMGAVIPQGEAAQGKAGVKMSMVNISDIASNEGVAGEINKNYMLVQDANGRPLVQATLDDQVLFVDAKTGKSMPKGKIKAGDKVKVYHSMNMTKSIPPQANAYAVIVAKNGEAMPNCYEVGNLNKHGKKRPITFIDVNKDVEVTMDAKACKNYMDLKVGDKVLVWSDLMTLSIPAHMNATKAVIISK